MYKEIRTPADSAKLQVHLNTLATQSSASALIFNGAKSKSQSITRKKKPVLFTYTMNNSNLDSIKCQPNLGIWITTDLTWNKEVLEQSAKANKILGYVRRNTKFIRNTEVRRSIYLTLVRPHWATERKSGCHSPSS